MGTLVTGRNFTTLFFNIIIFLITHLISFNDSIYLMINFSLVFYSRFLFIHICPVKDTKTYLITLVVNSNPPHRGLQAVYQAA